MHLLHYLFILVNVSSWKYSRLLLAHVSACDFNNALEINMN